jgi:hypothetical protein
LQQDRLETRSILAAQRARQGQLQGQLQAAGQQRESLRQQLDTTVGILIALLPLVGQVGKAGGVGVGVVVGGWVWVICRLLLACTLLECRIGGCFVCYATLAC